MVLSPFVVHLDVNGLTTIQGPVLVDSKKKNAQMESIAAVYTHVNRTGPAPLDLVAGPDINRFRAMPPGVPGYSFTHPVRVVSSMSGGEREQQVAAGRTVYILMKEGHRYIGAFVYALDHRGNATMRVDRYSD
jgi:hypothetical protein